MKRMSLLAALILFAAIISLSISASAYAEPKISNCDISPKEIGTRTEVTFSFDYANVEGGLKGGKIALTQKIQLPGNERVVTRTSNWQSQLQDLSTYPSESGRFEKKFTNADIWRGPNIAIIYEFKVTDQKGGESNACTVKIRPR
jgi:hypothetical protein